jgi:hypothetical protein
MELRIFGKLKDKLKDINLDKLKSKFKKNNDEDEFEDDIDDEEYEDDLSPEDGLTGEINISELEDEISNQDATSTEALDINSDLGDELSQELESELSDQFEDELGDEDLLLEADEVTGDLPFDAIEDIETEIEDINDELELEASQYQEEDEDEEYEDELEGPLGKLVEKLPFLRPIIEKLNKKKASKSDDSTRTEIHSDDVDEDDTAEKDFKVTLVKKLPFLAKFLNKKNKKDNDDDDQDSDEYSVSSDDEDEKPKKKITPVHIIAMIAIAYFAYDTLMETPEEPVAPVVKKRTIKKTPPKKIKPAKIEPKEEVKDEVKEEVKDEVKNEVDVEKDPPEETLDDLFEDETPPKAVDKNIDKVSETENETENDSKVESDALEDDVDADENPSEGEVVDSMPVDSMGAKETEDSLDGVIDDSIIGGSTSTDITESILKDLEIKVEKTKKLEKIESSVKPVDAPEYEMIGRSLVYNCSGKHWACIDSVNYKICGQNYSWNSEKGKAIECYPADNYDSIEDCAQVQQSKIDNVVETNFCQ